MENICIFVDYVMRCVGGEDPGGGFSDILNYDLNCVCEVYCLLTVQEGGGGQLMCGLPHRHPGTPEALSFGSFLFIVIAFGAVLCKLRD